MDNNTDGDSATEANASSTIPTEQGTDTRFTQFLEYQAAQILWKLWPPVIIFVGTFGNGAIILVVRRLKDDNSAQYAILMSLATSNLCLLYSGPLWDWVRNQFHLDVPALHSVTCKLTSWLIYVANTVSAWLVTGVTVQRTMAVIWPHKVRLVCSVRRAWIIVAALVFSASALHSHFLFGIVLSEDNVCTFSSTSYRQFYERIFMWVDMCFSSFLSSITLLVCDFILSWALFKATSAKSLAAQGISNANALRGSKSRRTTASRATAMILALSTTCLLLTMPVCICLLWYNHVPISQNPRLLAKKELAYTVTLLLWYTNSAVCCVLYCFTGTKFRTEFLAWVFCHAQCIASEIDLDEATQGSGTKGRKK
ncbi:cysteinyl leukotriene receptor 1-like [Babylonia areolata]|uniref:cysteinyl leukotriene receptor 1-like n=1 Tax=Babylonia areolata TaxID=304850 RepID=UPI003FD65CA2